MTSYKLYVTDISKTLLVLTQHGYEAQSSGTYVEIYMNEANKMNVIKLLNGAQIVILDIE